ncbi:hypothetical protein PG997_013702 [Apiospora hydei]|uniref:Uncharacterized protein n=1 Tax=Apiospora hydei TaxID=1337664 RepID=A0ABR1V6Y8_9PEZI
MVAGGINTRHRFSFPILIYQLDTAQLAVQTILLAPVRLCEGAAILERRWTCMVINVSPVAAYKRGEEALFKYRKMKSHSSSAASFTNIPGSSASSSSRRL